LAGRKEGGLAAVSEGHNRSTRETHSSRTRSLQKRRTQTKPTKLWGQGEDKRREGPRSVSARLRLEGTKVVVTTARREGPFSGSGKIPKKH